MIYTDKKSFLEFLKGFGICKINLEDLSEELRGDKEVALAVVKKDIKLFKDLDEELQGSKEFIIEVAKHRSSVLKYVSEELRRDKELVLAVVKQSGEALKYASKELRGDREVVLAAVEQYGDLSKQRVDVLEYASEEIKNDIEFCAKARLIGPNYCAFSGNELENLSNSIGLMKKGKGKVRTLQERVRRKEQIEEALRQTVEKAQRDLRIAERLIKELEQLDIDGESGPEGH